MKETKPFPRFLMCAASSGSGKTLITCAILRILSRRGMLPAAYKCGPDYIDPMFHSKVLGIPSRNLDVFLMGAEGVKGALYRGSIGRNIGVVEGVMGFYDGVSAVSDEGSSYDICRITRTPAILVVNSKGMSRSIIPLVKGFVDFDKDGTIGGIILNNISPMVAGSVKKEIEKETKVPVIGILPKMKGVNLESRHLGLIMPSEIPDILSTIDIVADKLEENLDFEKLMSIAGSAENLQELVSVTGLSGNNEDPISISGSAIGSKETGGHIVDNQTRKSHAQGSDKNKIGVARDEAFCFYYEDNLDLLKAMGAELVFFSPIHDKKLPDAKGLIFGGGYPELYVKELSENRSMREDILSAAKAGMPILAECGGFLYLQESLKDPDGIEHEMVGLFTGKGSKKDKLQHFGYVTMSAASDNPYLLEGEEIKAHEFHYYDTSCNGDVCVLKKMSGASWSGYQAVNKSFGGFAHLYYPSNVDFIRRFLLNY